MSPASDHSPIVPPEPSPILAAPLAMPGWSRRCVLRGGAMAVMVVGLTSACASDEPEPPDPLEAPAQRARHDAESIAAAVAIQPELADTLGVTAAERSAHADALDAEIDRLRPVTSSTEAPTTTETPAVTPPSLDQVRSDLTAAADEAGALALTVSGYRRGLLGSIAAACRTQVAVALP